ncbi:MAG: TonB-dependent receptor plug domain-containing protein [Spirochaetes bacterium]|nr:TonB-dependent receptor plug domain-containing protein [Spirochaetota bacterium]
MCALIIIFTAALLPLSVTVNVNDGIKQVPDAAVLIKETGIENYSDAQGKAVFKDVKPGVYSITAVLGGFEKKELSLAVSNNTNVSITLIPVVMQARDVTVRAKRNKGSVTSQTTIRKEDLSRTTQSFMNDALKAVQAMPGVSTSGSTFDSRMYIQGGGVYEWLPTIDGTYVINPYRWGGNTSMFNPNTIESIDLYTAGYPASYAQCLSGVLDVKTLNPASEGWHGIFDLSSATMEGVLRGAFSSNVRMVASVRGTFYDWVAPLFVKNGSGIQFPYLWDGMLKLIFDVTPRDTITLLGMGSLEGMKWDLGINAGDNGGPPAGMSGNFFYRTINVIASAGYEHRFSDSNTIKAIAAFTPQITDLRTTGSGVTWLNDLSFTQYVLETGVDWHFGELTGHRFSSGLASYWFNAFGSIAMTNYWINELGQWTNNGTKTTFDKINDWLYGAAYAMDDITVVPGLIMQLGARGEYFLRTKEWIAEPRGGLKIEATSDLDIFLRGGLYAFYPFSMQMLEGNTGNPELKADKAIHGITGVDFANDIFTARVEGFYKHYYDIAESDTVDHFRNNGERNIYGGDIYLQKKSASNDWINGWVSYTYINGRERVTNRSPETPTATYEVADGFWFTPSYVREHTVSAILELTYRSNTVTPYFNWLEGWKISFDFRMLSGKPYTPVTNYIALYVPGFGTNYRFINGEYLSERTPWTQKLDLKITMPYSPFSFLSLFGINLKNSSYISLLNVYNHENIVDYYYYVNKSGDLTRTATKDFGFMVLGGFRTEW